MDGGKAWSCDVPPFGVPDVAEAAHWLHATRRDGVLAARADTTSADEAHSPFLRATIYLDSRQMDSGRWYRLALMLRRRWLTSPSALFDDRAPSAGRPAAPRAPAAPTHP